MKDEVLEILAPDLLRPYRRWRPWLTAMMVLAVVLAAGAQLTAIIVGQDCGLRSFIVGLLHASVGIGLLQIVLDKRLTRSISQMGSQFSTRFRHVLMAAWLTATLTGYATVDAVYRPFHEQQRGYYTCNW